LPHLIYFVENQIEPLKELLKMKTSIEKTKILMTEGYNLSANLFLPESPKAVILVGSALGIGQYFYFGIANYLSEQGFAVITHDYRGIGESAPAKLFRKFDAGFVQLGKDFDQVFEFANTRFPFLPKQLLGHSLGGIIPMFAKNIKKCSAAFLVGSQTAYYKDFGNSKSQFIKTTLAWHIVIPFLTQLFGYFPAKNLNLKSENIPFKLIFDIQKRRNSIEATDFLTKIGVDSQHLKLKCPVFAVTMSDDAICTPSAMKRLLTDFKNADINYAVIDNNPIGKVGHAGFFKRKYEENLWSKVSEWFNENLLEKHKALEQEFS
jgi:predicted alpha/beta hydrolase